MRSAVNPATVRLAPIFEQRRRGFTLVELLVVVCIIGILFGRIGPAMSRPHGKSGRIKCVSNLKQIGLAFKVFAGDNNDLYPYQVSTNVAYLAETRTWIHFQGMSNELSTAKILLCPEDKTRSENMAENFHIGTNATSKSLSVRRNDAVSYFVGIGVSESMPQAILAGDRSVSEGDPELPALSARRSGGALSIRTNSVWSVFPANKIHDYQGNLLMGDGSVNQASVSILRNQTKLAIESHGTNFNRYVFPQ